MRSLKRRVTLGTIRTAIGQYIQITLANRRAPLLHSSRGTTADATRATQHFVPFGNFLLAGGNTNGTQRTRANDHHDNHGNIDFRGTAAARFRNISSPYSSY